ATDGNLGLRTLRRPVQGKEPLLLFQKHRAAKSKRSLHDNEFFRATPRTSQSERSGQRWHDRARRHRRDRRRQTDGLWPRDLRFRLAAMESRSEEHTSEL